MIRCLGRKAIIFPSENSRLSYYNTELTNDIVNLSMKTGWFSITKQEFYCNFIQEFPSKLSVSNNTHNDALDLLFDIIAATLYQILKLYMIESILIILPVFIFASKGK